MQGNRLDVAEESHGELRRRYSGFWRSWVDSWCMLRRGDARRLGLGALVVGIGMGRLV